jgi:hypothetical protein
MTRARAQNTKAALPVPQALPWFLRRERDQSLCHRRLTQGPLSVMAKM